MKQLTARETPTIRIGCLFKQPIDKEEMDMCAAIAMQSWVAGFIPAPGHLIKTGIYTWQVSTVIHSLVDGVPKIDVCLE